MPRQTEPSNMSIYVRPRDERVIAILHHLTRQLCHRIYSSTLFRNHLNIDPLCRQESFAFRSPHFEFWGPLFQDLAGNRH